MKIKDITLKQLEFFEKHQEENKALRIIRQGAPKELGKVYLHVSDSGATFSVVDEGYGPTVKVRTSSFGNLEQVLKVHADKASLIALGKMFSAAAQYEGFTENYCNNARPSSVVIDGVEKIVKDNRILTEDYEEK